MQPTATGLGTTPADDHRAEQVLLQQGSTLVSDRRFVADGRSFRIDQLLGASTLVQKPSRRIPVALILLGIVGAALAVYGAYILVVIGAAWAASQRTQYRLGLSTRTDGEAVLLRGPRREPIDAVVAALSQVIGHAR